MLYLFDDYILDTQLYELRHAGAPCPLEPQVFAVLHYLIQHRDRVVTRQELLEHVWPERFISEATLDHRVMEVRQAIGDSGQTQRRMHTLRGRGYRFVGTVEECTAASTPSLAPLLPQVPAIVGAPAVLVGRDAELAQLHQRYAAACQGQRQVVFITGEVGIGKTTLVDAFVTEVGAHADLWVGRGQCIEHHGSGEAYLPLLEALSQLGRSPPGGDLGALLRQYAPSWLLHLPTLVPVPELEALQRRASGVTRERMLREPAEAVEALTTARPLVLAVQAQADALLALATAQGFSFWVGFGTCMRGWVLAMQGQGAEGVAQMHQGMAMVLATGQMLAQSFCLVLLAEATGHVGQEEEGLRLLTEALAVLEASGRGDLLAEAYRLQGELLLRQASPKAAQAEACFQQALATARRQQAKSWELRAAVSLSRLWQQQGKPDAARQLLAPIYSWFTEGFDTADLQEAKALLEDETITKQRLG
jgi:DNA-binding winged helix-turn-helix (wHTH) protein/tetratricopeptide (TPR) repeat protein